MVESWGAAFVYDEATGDRFADALAPGRLTFLP
jgi:hypothetical protein